MLHGLQFMSFLWLYSQYILLQWVMSDLSWGVRATSFRLCLVLFHLHHQEASYLLWGKEKQDDAGEVRKCDFLVHRAHSHPCHPCFVLFPTLLPTQSFTLVWTFNWMGLLFLRDLNTLRVNLNQGAKATKRVSLPQCRGLSAPSNPAATATVSFLILFVKTIILWSKQGDQWVDGDGITTKLIGFPGSNTSQLTLHWGN